MAEPGSPDWTKLEHAYGAAVDVPAALADLADVDAATRARALDFLSRSIHHQASVFPATVPAVPVLIAALDRANVDRASVLALLGAIALGDTTAYQVGGLKEPRPSRRPSVQERCFSAVKEGLPRYRALLGDASATTRAAAAFLLAWFSSGADASRAALRAGLATETDAAVQASGLLALGYLGAAQGTAGDAAGVRAFLAPDGPAVVRTAAAIALVHLARERCGPEVFAALRGAAADEAPIAVPFSDGDLGALALAVLPLLPEEAGDVDAALLELIASPTRGDEAAAIALARSFPPERVARASDLAPARRALLAAIARNPACFTSLVSESLERRSIPGQALPLQEWLGIASERPAGLLDRPFARGGVTRPLAEWLLDAARESAADREALAGELAAALPPGDLARLVLDADVRLEVSPAGGSAAVAFTGLLFDLMALCGAGAADLLGAEAERLLRDGPPGKLTRLGTVLCTTQLHLVGVGLAFASLARGEDAPEWLDRLLSSPPRPPYAALVEALGALPGPRRDAWILAPEVDFEAQPSESMVGAWPCFVRWPSAAVTARVLALASGWKAKDRWGRPRKVHADPYLRRYAQALRSAGNEADAARCEALLPR